MIDKGNNVNGWGRERMCGWPGEVVPGAWDGGGQWCTKENEHFCKVSLKLKQVKECRQL